MAGEAKRMVSKLRMLLAMMAPETSRTLPENVVGASPPERTVLSDRVAFSLMTTVLSVALPLSLMPPVTDPKTLPPDIIT